MSFGTDDAARQKAAATLMETFSKPDKPDGQVPVIDYDIVHEIESQPHDILYPGLTITFNGSEAQSQFIKLAKDLFAQSKGPHAEDGVVKPDYAFAIRRLPWESVSVHVPEDGEAYEANAKVYPLHVTDAALEILAQPKNLKKIAKHFAIEEEKEGKTGYEGTAGQRVVPLQPRDGGRSR